MKISGLIFLLFFANQIFAETYVNDPGFELVNEKRTFVEWNWWERESGKGKTEVSTNAHSGKNAIRITHAGEKDWNVTNSKRTSVRPGESFRLSCWIKNNSPAHNLPALEVVGCKDKKVVEWAIGRSRGPKREGWNGNKSYFIVPDNIDSIYVRLNGQGKTDVLVDDVCLERASNPAMEKKPKVEGWLPQRPIEPMGRGLVACQAEGGTYVGWRLLKDDPANCSFDLFREANGQRLKLNASPLVQTTDFVDTNTFLASARYTIEMHQGKHEITSIHPIARDNRKTPYIRIPLAATNAVAQKIGVADLDGDGVYEYVIKQPGENVDPYEKYWYKSPDTFKIEARKQDGTLLWIKDLGWNIERGMWYSPMIVADLTGDGRAEVAVKIGPEEDCRDAEGKVDKGPEWVAILDGLTGTEITRTPWPARERFPSYNYSSRNQLAIAYLDGRTPCLIVLRGTYNVMLADAYQLRNNKLEKLWSYSNEELPGNYQGQGAHNCLCADIDNDGRDEVLLGSIALDDDGSVLWATGKGHPDAHYLGDIDPLRPGLEMAYIIETRQKTGGGIHLLDPTTGKIIWQLNEPTEHVHSCGICSDLDPRHAGLEIYGADSKAHESTGKRWLFASDGTLLKSGSQVDFKFGVPSAYWDADLQRELIRGKAVDYDGCTVSERIEGSVVLIADVLGDWREEVIASVPGELRIYVSTIPAFDRRVCLMQDTLYRMRTTMNAMGYMQVPLLSYLPESQSPNINMTLMGEGKKQLGRIVISAPRHAGIKGTLTLIAPARIKLSETTKAIDLKPNERIELKIPFEGTGQHNESLRATLNIDGSAPLSVYAPFDL
jgi:rhamnogalacturonan endolyase